MAYRSFRTADVASTSPRYELGKVAFSRMFHGLVDPLCGTSWDKWNWDKLHRGYGACPGTRKSLQRGYMTCPMGQGEVSFDLSQSQLGQAVLVPLGQAQLVPICLSHWDRLCLSQWLVPVGQDRYRHHPSKVSPWPRWGSFLIKNSKDPNRISEIPYQKSVSNWSKILTKNRIVFPKLTHAWSQWKWILNIANPVTVRGDTRVVFGLFYKTMSFLEMHSIRCQQSILSIQVWHHFPHRNTFIVYSLIGVQSFWMRN